MNVLGSLIKKGLPAGIMLNALGKSNPRLGSFIASALSSGYEASNLVDFIRSKMEPTGQASQRGKFENKEAQGTLRPDEALQLKQSREAKVPGNILQGAASVGAGLAGGATNILPQAIGALGGALGLGGQQQPQQAQQPQQPQPQGQPQAMPQQGGQQPQQQQQAPQQAPPEGAKPGYDTEKGKTWIELKYYLEKLLKAGHEPESAVKSARKFPKYRKLIDDYEQGGKVGFIDAVKGMFGSMPKGQQQAPQAQQGQPTQAMSDYDQQLTQAIQLANERRNRGR